MSFVGWSVITVVAVGCSGGSVADSASDTSTASEKSDPPVASFADCRESELPKIDPELGTLASEFRDNYAAYDLGTPPLPEGETSETFFDPLGGIIIPRDDRNRLIFVARSESRSAALYSVEITRDECDHISGFVGKSVHLVDVSRAAVGLAFADDGTLFVSQFQLAGIAQLAPDFSIIRETSLDTMGVDGPGGLSKVPAGFANEGAFRIVGYPSGRWYELDMTKTEAGYNPTGVHAVVTLDHGPGGIAYVPPNSPAFGDKRYALLTEWFQGRFQVEGNFDPAVQRVAVYEVDERGNPIGETRRDFFEKFDRPWAGYFDEFSGDFLFLSWNRSPDRVVAVRGFKPLL